MVECRDLYDKDRNLTGKTIAKGEEIPKGYYITIVVCFMENNNGKFLMQKRSVQKRRIMGYNWWSSKIW